jgi:uncharacterized membrane-anchored protein YitT (DUF2179 family)
MKLIFQPAIVNLINLFKRQKVATTYSSYRIAKEKRIERKSRISLFRDSLFILLGILSAGFGLKGFLLPNSFIDGGVTGISLLVSGQTGISLSWLLVFINIPFIILGYRQIGKSFAIKSVGAIAGLALVLWLIQYPVITSDKLLVAAFGGFFLGAGIGLAVRGGGVLDGTEIMAISINKKSALSIGDIILIFNVLVFTAAAYLLSMESALYSILTYLAASKTVDFIIEGVEGYIGTTIISPHSEEIRLMIIEKMNRGVTIYKGKRGYGKSGDILNETDIIYTVITRLEISKLRSEIEKIDPNAFIVMNDIKSTKGGMTKRRYPKH